MQLMAEARVTRIGPGIQSWGGGALNLSLLEPIDCPLPNLQIFLACVISGIDLIFHSFYRAVVLTSWDRGPSDCEPHRLPVGGILSFTALSGSGSPIPQKNEIVD